MRKAILLGLALALSPALVLAQVTLPNSGSFLVPNGNCLVIEPAPTGTVLVPFLCSNITPPPPPTCVTPAVQFCLAANSQYINITGL